MRLRERDTTQLKRNLCHKMKELL